MIAKNLNLMKIQKTNLIIAKNLKNKVFLCYKLGIKYVINYNFAFKYIVWGTRLLLRTFRYRYIWLVNDFFRLKKQLSLRIKSILFVYLDKSL